MVTAGAAETVPSDDDDDPTCFSQRLSAGLVPRSIAVLGVVLLAVVLDRDPEMLVRVLDLALPQPGTHAQTWAAGIGNPSS